MSTHPAATAARRSGRVIVAVLDGRPWTASSIRHRNLRQHCRMLGRAVVRPHPQFLRLQPALRRLLGVVAERGEILTGLHPSELGVVPVLMRAAAYAGRWLRDPEDWHPNAAAPPRDQAHSLLRHLFNAHPLPAFFDSAWRTEGDLIHLERDWYCHLAAGGRSRHADGLPHSVTARAWHLMMQDAPSHLTVRQALRWGQATAAGCPPAMIEAILRSPMVNDLSHDRIWFRLMEKTAAAAAFNPSEWNWLVDGLRHVIRHESWRRAGRLVDLPLPTLLAHCRRLFARLLAAVTADGSPASPALLEKSGFRQALSHLATTCWPAWLEDDAPGSVPCPIPACPARWSFHELTNLTQLLAEGAAQRHCVATYRRPCQTGRSAIISLRHGDANTPEPASRAGRELTLEIDRASRQIIQIRGRWNRQATPLEMQVIRQWAGQHRLGVA